MRGCCQRVAATVCCAGSYNFSRSAARNNSENALLLQDMPAVAQQYLTHWQSRWDMGTDWSPLR
ncbi:hypothetical protein [Erwinia aphidicola]|uniref:hypothetical protein n=1 Tax=Erwinia aphidicola TaxID=68334 RepID=UPI003AB87F2E